MAFQLSPGISVSELDITSVVPAVSTTTGAIAGVFAWGPVLEPVLVSSEVELVKRFGAATTNFNIETFFTAADFLSYSNSLYVSRANTGVTAANTTLTNLAGQASITAKYPGAYGNSIRIVYTSKGAADANTVLNSIVTTPDTDCVNIAIIDTLGTFTGVTNGILEVYQNVAANNSSTNAQLADGTNNYWMDVINTKSNYVKVANTAATPTFASAGDVTLSGGTNGSDETAITVSSLQTAYDVFKNPEDVDVSLIMQGKARGIDNATELGDYIAAIAATRMDAIAFISPDKDDVVGATDPKANVLAFANSITSSSYAVVDSGYKYRYDRYNDKYVYTPLNGDIAGLCARTDNTNDAWFSPAGYNRGSIKNVIKLAYNPGKTDRDALYMASVNPVVTQPGQGTILFGDKTALKRASAFDRINVRRLFIVLEKAISRASKSTMFEFNDEFTRAQFRNLVEPFLRDVQGRRGIYDFKVVCDESNNTAEVVDRNEFRGDIYIKPARSINFVQLNFVAVRTGVQFEEIIGKR
jgi:phage tail sheath protein FI